VNQQEPFYTLRGLGFKLFFKFVCDYGVIYNISAIDGKTLTLTTQVAGFGSSGFRLSLPNPEP
jgi:hypothetical protein